MYRRLVQTHYALGGLFQWNILVKTTLQYFKFVPKSYLQCEHSCLNQKRKISRLQ